MVPLRSVRACLALVLVSGAASSQGGGSTGPFTIVALPDTQGYVEDHGAGYGQVYEDRFLRQMQWILAQRSALNIRFVSHLGDVVQHFASYGNEWDSAEGFLDMLHVGNDPTQPALIPYSLAIGNHDFDSKQWVPGTANPPVNVAMGTSRWEQTFGAAARFRGHGFPWYGGDDLGFQHQGHTGRGLSTWQTFTGGGRTFLHLNLELGMPDWTIAWAETVLAAHPGVPTIVTTHAYLDFSGDPVTLDQTWRRDVGNSGQEMWDLFLRRHPQIFFVLCGHIGVQRMRVAYNDAGQPVFTQMACYTIKRLPTDAFFNGAGWLWVLQLDPGAETIRCRAYSTELNVWASNAGGTPVYTYPNAAVGPPDNHSKSDFVLQFDWDDRLGPTPPSVQTYCSGKPSSNGCVPFIAGYGVPRVSGNEPFLVAAEDAVPGETGFLIYGRQSSSLSFHGGTLCVGTPFSRVLPLRLAKASGSLSCPGSGRLQRDFAERIRSGVDPALSTGATVRAQWRQRDPQDPSGFGDALTNGLRFVIAP